MIGEGLRRVAKDIEEMSKGCRRVLGLLADGYGDEDYMKNR